MAAGTILRQQSSAGQLTYISGRLTAPASGRFFFHTQTLPGVAGPFSGVVELPSLGIAYRVEPAGSGRGSELVQRPLRNVVCMDLPRPDKRRVAKVGEVPPLNPADFPQEPIPGYQNGVIVLESLHGAKAVIYLDFQGGYTESWGGIAYQRSNFGNADIFEIWRRVSEDFMPFNINVTTDLKAFEGGAQNSRQRVIVTPTETAWPGAGGVAYVGTFDSTVDIPCWVFDTEEPKPKYAAEACAHEAGHSLGLIHDGQQINGTHFEYFYGHGGNNVTGWAPIMGVSYYDSVTQWSKGEYLDANNPEDQLRIIANQNNVQFRPDDTGDTLATSRYLEIYRNYTASAEGVIETTGDTDAFQFTTTGGEVFLQANPAALGPNLAIAISLYDSSDTLLASNNPQDTLSASLSTNLPAGTYTFRVTGSGRNDPLTSGFSSYASLGYYSITGQVANARLPNRFAIPENAPNGTLVGVVPSLAPATDIFTYSISSGNRGDTFAIDSSGTLTVANNSLLDYETLATNTSHSPVQFELFVNIMDTLQPLFNETNRRVLVAVTNVKKPPVIAGSVWSGGASAGDWSQPDNWNGSLPNNHSKLVFEGTNQLVNNNDFLQRAGLVKLSNGGFYIDGNPLVLHAGLQNLGTNTWAIDSTLDSTQTLDCAAGKLTIAGALKNADNQITFQVNSTMVLDGEVSGSGGLLKLGGGPLVINSTNSYTGPTDVERGTLLLSNSGSIAASPTLNVAAGATLNVQGTSGLCPVPAGQNLTGNGTVVGPILIAGKLTPALAASGKSLPQAMLFSNRLVLAGETSLTISQNAALNQTIKVAGEVHYGGVLTVSTNTNEILPGGQFEGQIFRLFNASNYVGSFSEVNLPPGYQWDTSQLSTNGTIRLVGSAPSLPPNLLITYGDGTVFIRFQSAAAKHYALESTGSLQPPVHWGQSAFETGTGGIVSIPFKVLTNSPQRFFQVREY